MPTYPYNDTPQATQRKNATQPLIKTNFLSINSTISEEHLPINDPGANAGKHKFVTLPEQGASPATAVNQGAVFTRQGVNTVKTELCFRREGPAGAVVECTAQGWNAGNHRGWTYLPSGLLVKYGYSIANGVTDFTNADAPFYTTIYNTQLTTLATPADSNSIVTLMSVTVNAGVSFVLKIDGSFRLAAVPKAVNFYWMTIGI